MTDSGRALPRTSAASVLVPVVSHSHPPPHLCRRPSNTGRCPQATYTQRRGAKSKAEPQELCEQRREREISPSSLRSSGLNLHNQLDVPCICGIPE